MLSGVFLGVAFLTKFYAIFMLVPLAVFYFYYPRRVLRNPLAVLAFFLPVLVLLLIWYQGVCHISILTIFWQDDFKFYNTTAGSMPSYLFTFNYLNANLGGFFLAATFISVLVTTFQAKLFRNVRAADVACIAAILVVLGVDSLLALGLNFKAPYTSAVKYDYQALPFFCLLAGSILVKGQSLFMGLKMKLTRSALFFRIACLGAVCLVITIFSNFYYVNLYSQLSVVMFRVEGQVSYSFSNSAQIIEPNSQVYIQYVGFALVLSGLIWAVKDKIPKKSLAPHL